MISHLFDLIRAQLTNPFVSGGLLLTFTASIIALARSLPARIWARIKEQFIVEVEVASFDPLFDYVTLWLNDQPYSKRTRRLIATTGTNCENSNGQCVPCAPGGDYETPRPKLILTPARGMHLFLWEKRLLWLTRGHVTDGEPAGNNKLGSSYSRFRPEQYTLRVFGRHQEVLRNLLNVVIDQAVKSQEKKISAYVAIFGNWRRLTTFTPRKLESVILPAGKAEDLLKRLKDFISEQPWYAEMGIPYHLGILLHGCPGSGKTSVIGALAGELRMNLYLINLANEEMTDERFASLLSEIQPRSFMVLEDIDAALAAHKRHPDRDGQTGLTLTGLLNSLDGFMAKEGSIVFMTTNHKELLDPALLRPGRVDYELEFKPAEPEQLERLFYRFFLGPIESPFPDATQMLAKSFAMRRELRTMAEAQQRLIKYRGDARAVALADAPEVVAR